MTHFVCLYKKPMASASVHQRPHQPQRWRAASFCSLFHLWVLSVIWYLVLYEFLSIINFKYSPSKESAFSLNFLLSRSTAKGNLHTLNFWFQLWIKCRPQWPQTPRKWPGMPVIANPLPCLHSTSSSSQNGAAQTGKGSFLKDIFTTYLVEVWPLAVQEISPMRTREGRG